ncbi:MAG: phosphoribosyltransferase [Anaerolineales bacterium]
MNSPNEPIRHELVTWEEVDRIVDHLVLQIQAVRGFDGIVMVTRGGLIPGGLLAEALDLTYVLTAAVRFNDQGYTEFTHPQTSKFALPSFLQFPETDLLRGRQLLLVDDVWGSGRTSMSIKGRLEAAQATVYTCVFHFNPYRSLFADEKPSFYGALTNAYVIYPWEIDRGLDRTEELDPQI